MTRKSRRRGRLALVVTAFVLAFAAAAVWLLLTSKSIFPPRTLVMATGPDGGAFAESGARYRAILARGGVDLRLLPTAGAVENLAKLRDPASGVSAAIVDAGTTTPKDSSDLVSLGTVSFEPIWFFLRGQLHGPPAVALQGKRISIGSEGSGSREVARRLLQLNGVDEQSLVVLALSPQQAAQALLRGEIDAAVLLTSWQSPVLQKLLRADGVVLLTYPRADAYVALFPFLNKLVLPAGVVDLAKNIPQADVTLLAVEASLAVRKNLHPAVQYLLLEAAAAVHGGPGVFQRAGRFPAPEAVDLPLSREAEQFYKSGRPYLYRLLPFWLADLAERALIILVPLVALVFPLVRFVPMLYETYGERRVFKLYRDLKLIEMELEMLPAGEARHDLASDLDELAGRANRMKVPLHFAQRLFILKNHIAVAQERLEKLRSTAAKPAGA